MSFAQMWMDVETAIQGGVSQKETKIDIVY